MRPLLGIPARWLLEPHVVKSPVTQLLESTWVTAIREFPALRTTPVTPKKMAIHRKKTARMLHKRWRQLGMMVGIANLDLLRAPTATHPLKNSP